MDDKLFIDIALLISKESKCQSLQVGAVIVKDKRVISMGINGTPNNFINCNEVTFKDSETKQFVSEHTHSSVDMNHTEWSMIHEIHAEMNAILYAAKKGFPIENSTMYVTHEPCDQCLKNIIQSGISRVVYLNNYNGNVTLDSGYRKKCTSYISLEQYMPPIDNGFILTPKDNSALNIKYTKGIDQHKANVSNSYIGFGVKGTSTYNYMQDAIKCGLKVNSIDYDKNDVVFVSVNGGGNFRYDNCNKTVDLCIKALDSGASIIMDTDENRKLAYNAGERYTIEEVLKHYEFLNQSLYILKKDFYNLYKLKI